MASTVSKLRKQRLKNAIRRDVLFLLAGAVAYFIVSYIETNASDHEMRFASSLTQSNGNNGTICIDNQQQDSCGLPTPPQKKIIDAGFILTKPIHSYLARNRDINDILALANSLLLTIPIGYVVYVTLWKGDFRLSFRLIATLLFRSLCGWFTYLPPDPEFLSSLYDMPEMFLCLFQECMSHEQSHNAHQVIDFLTFFSGHVAATNIIANHMYMAKHTRMSVVLHGFNWLQAIRLLATRGHYSIDLIIGYVVAVFVSSPAERLGLYYSLGIWLELPGMVEAFELLVGASASGYGENKEVEKKAVTQPSTTLADNTNHSIQSETSVRIAVDIVADMAQLKKE